MFLLRSDEACETDEEIFRKIHILLAKNISNMCDSPCFLFLHGELVCVFGSTTLQSIDVVLSIKILLKIFVLLQKFQKFKHILLCFKVTELEDASWIKGLLNEK